ncbi:DUF448 domain-containing protein, partial [Priestia megaterium]
LLAKKKNVLSTHLGASIDEAVYEELLALVEKEKQSR